MPTLLELLEEESAEELSVAHAWSEQLADPELGLSVFLAAEAALILGAARFLGFGVAPAAAAFEREAGRQVAPSAVVQLNAPVIVRLAGRREIVASPARRVDSDTRDALFRIRAELANRVGWDEERIVVIACPPGAPQVAPGDAAHCGGQPGSFGARIVTSAGQRGILTAGHVAPKRAAGAFDSGANLLGVVADTVNYASVPPGTATPDIATIELAAHVRDDPAPGAKSPGTVRTWQSVTAYGAKTSGKTSQISTALVSFAGPNQNVGDFGLSAMTMRPISAPGDSGACVYNNAGDLVGHIVSGYPGVYSVMQDITYQLEEFGATLR